MARVKLGALLEELHSVQIDGKHRDLPVGAVE